MKERMLVLAKAAPIVSSKYEHLICVAGITENGEWRRIYPIPFKLFLTGHGFKKKSWIEYELENPEPSNHRPESRKIIPESVKQLEEEDYGKIHELLQSRVTSLEELQSKSHREVSLGVIKPKIMDFYAGENKHLAKMIKKCGQRNIFGKSVVRIDTTEKEFSYVFECCDNCNKKHDILVEDWEVAELYRNCKKYWKMGKYPSESVVIMKVREKMFEWMKNRKEVFFIVGTHFKFNTYIIIGIVYPRKNDKF